MPLAVALALVAACQPVLPKPSADAPSTARPTATPQPRHIFVIVLENTSYSLALAQPYISSLAEQYTVATNYHDVASPSLPNYLAMTSGSTWDIADNEYHNLPETGIGYQLSQAGISWRAYFEGLSGDCFNSPYPYALKHNPFAYYGGDCPFNVVPMSQLTDDLNGDTPRLSWITPGLCNDGHDCGVESADRWLSQVVPLITGSSAWQHNGALFITWDESSAGDQHVALLVVTPKSSGEISQRLDHYSLLATLEDQFGVPRLGLARQATSISKQLK